MSGIGSASPAANEERSPASHREWFRALAESSRDIVLVRDAHGVLTYCSPAVSVLLGFEPAELEGTSESDLLHPTDFKIRSALIAELLETNVAQPPVEVRLRTKAGSWRWFETIDTNCLDNDAVRGIITNARDLTESRAFAAELVEQGLHDALTGLPNRSLVTDRIAVALARAARSDTLVAVLFCGLDGAEVVNESIGHEAGDQVVVEVARRFQDALRAADTVARIGTDVFVVVCEGVASVDEATTMAKKIRSAVEQPIAFDSFEAAVALSVGIVVVPGAEASETSPMILLRNGDAAMYRARLDGTSSWALFDESLISAATRRREVEPELRRALAGEEFVLHYQPIYDLTDHAVVGVEALVRWNHPTRGVLAPDAFIGLAEETGLIVGIGEWVLEEACRQMREWCDTIAWAGSMSINLSARQIAEPGLAAVVQDVLGTAEVTADRFRLELTETALLRAGHSAAAELGAIRNLGVHVGLDDFGTGYATLSNLQQLPVDFLKIDRSFVTTLNCRGGKGDGNAIVAAISQIGHALELVTIAEGVETEEQEDMLRRFGCPYAQGFLFARPAPAVDLTPFLASRA